MFTFLIGVFKLINVKKNGKFVSSFVLIGLLLYSCVKKVSENYEPLGQISGIVKTTANEPMDSAIVTIETSPTQSMTTGLDGKYHFSHLKIGEYLISVTRKGFQNKSQTLDLTAGSTLDFIFPSIFDRLTKKWIFSKKPQENWNWYSGHLENRTVFDGTEELEFASDGRFYINNACYGSWLVKPHGGLLPNLFVIDCDMTSSAGYAAFGYNINRLECDILSISDSTMLLNHSYYKYTYNRYELKVKN